MRFDALIMRLDGSCRAKGGSSARVLTDIVSRWIWAIIRHCVAGAGGSCSSGARLIELNEEARSARIEASRKIGERLATCTCPDACEFAAVARASSPLFI